MMIDNKSVKASHFCLFTKAFLSVQMVIDMGRPFKNGLTRFAYSGARFDLFRVSVLVAILIVLTILIGGCSTPEGEGFAIYLTKEDVSPAQLEPLSKVTLSDPPLISMKDIVSYNRQTSELKLKGDAYERVRQLEVPTTGKSFVVCVDIKPIYGGAFWTPISSQSYDGVTIWKPMVASETLVIVLELGYPSSSFYNGEDPRNKPEIIESFRKAGVLIDSLTLSDIQSLPRSMKGYELYSWLESDGWHFTLITGTNRNKAKEEITSGESYISETGWINIHCLGQEAILAALAKVPSGEWVSWRNGAFVTDGGALTWPPQEMVDAIKRGAVDRGLTMNGP